MKPNCSWLKLILYRGNIGSDKLKSQYDLFTHKIIIGHLIYKF